MTYMGENVTTKFLVEHKNLPHVLAILETYGVRDEFLVSSADGGFVVELQGECMRPVYHLLLALAA